MKLLGKLWEDRREVRVEQQRMGGVFNQTHYTYVNNSETIKI